MQTIGSGETGPYRVFWALETPRGRYFVELMSETRHNHLVTVSDEDREATFRCKSGEGIKDALYDCIRKLDIKVLQWQQVAYESSVSEQGHQHQDGEQGPEAETD